MWLQEPFHAENVFAKKWYTLIPGTSIVARVLVMVSVSVMLMAVLIEIFVLMVVVVVWGLGLVVVVVRMVLGREWWLWG